MENKIIIYIAGNPNAYPIEYYNSQSKTFDGVIPRLLNEFSDKSRYEMIYYQPESTDNREHLAENMQVDVISACKDGDDILNNKQSVEVFSTMEEDSRISYYICYTDAAPESLKFDLNNYLSL